MKTKLEIAREQINQIDKEMIELFKKRMDAVKMVVEYKIENNMEVLDSKREDSLIKKNLELLNDSSLEKYYLEFFNSILSSSKNYQKNIIERKK